MTTIKAIKGFNDILASDSPKWRYVESKLISVLDGYGFSQIRLPIVEETQLFARGVGEATDIVEKEMYTFFDKGEPPTSLTLRPEGTAGAVRAVIEHNLTRGDTPKLWYMGAMLYPFIDAPWLIGYTLSSVRSRPFIVSSPDRAYLRKYMFTDGTYRSQICPFS